MNEENILQNEQQVPKQAYDWKKHFCTVTPFSKLLALALFVVLPFVGFWLGVGYGTQNVGLLDQTTLQTSEFVENDTGKRLNLPSPNTTSSNTDTTLKNIEADSGETDLPHFDHSSFVSTSTYLAKDGSSYFINEDGELIRKDGSGRIIKLVLLGQDIHIATSSWGEPHTYMKGAVLGFELSPDEQYISYAVQYNVVGCCGATSPVRPDVRLYTVNIDGTEKYLIDETSEGHRSQAHFSGWMFDSVHFVFYEQYMDEATQGSGFYVGSVGQSDVEVFTPLTLHDGTWTVAFAEPHFSPVDNLMVYIPDGIEGNRFVLSSTTGVAQQVLLEVPKIPNHSIQWSPDGELIYITLNHFDGTDEQYIFTKNGEKMTLDAQ